MRQTSIISGRLSAGLMAMISIFSLLLFSCKKDDDTRGYFTVDGDPSSIEIPAAGATENFSFRASGVWKIETVNGEDWVTISPSEGSGDGEFSVEIAKNTTLDPREVAITFMVDGRLQSNYLSISQQAGNGQGGSTESYVRVDDLTELQLDETAITQQYTVRATGDWRIELADQAADWINIEPLSGSGDTPISLSVETNSGSSRAVDLLFYLDDQLQSNRLTVIQAEASAIFNEDFSWLEYGSPIFYTTTGETRFDAWAENRGWSSTVNPIENKTPLTYARQGFVKLGKTSYGGDLISPKLSAIEGTKDVKVSFKAVPYQTAAGTRDATSLKIFVIGPGELSQDEFTIDNWPDYSLDPNCTEIWQMPETTRSFVIRGATAETQIRFLGGDFDLRPEVVDINKNRIFLDDIVVTLEK